MAERDGEYCRGCTALPHEKSLVLDHRNNNPKDNKPENLQILCRRCNYTKNPRGPLDLRESESKFEAKSELEISRAKEPLFKEYAHQRVDEDKQVPQDDLINSGAELVEISPITAKRYLDKMCSSTGTLRKKRVGNTTVIEFKNELKFV